MRHPAIVMLAALTTSTCRKVGNPSAGRKAAPEAAPRADPGRAVKTADAGAPGADAAPAPGSLAAPPPGQCRLRDGKPLDLGAVEGEPESVALAAKGLLARLMVTTWKGTFHLDLPTGAGAPSARVVIPETYNGSRPIAVPLVVDGDLATVGMFGWLDPKQTGNAADGGPAVTFERAGQRRVLGARDHLLNQYEVAYPYGGFYVRRIAAAASGKGWVAVLLGSLLECLASDYYTLDMVWGEHRCISTHHGYVGKSVGVRTNGARMYLIRPEGAGLKARPVELSKRGEGRPDSVFAVASGDGFLVTWRSLGAIRTAYARATPRGADDAGVEGQQTLAGGDLRSPRGALGVDGKLHVVWAQRARKGQPFALRTATYAYTPGPDSEPEREARITAPKVVPTPGTADVVSPVLVAAPGGFVLAWLDVGPSGSRLRIGKGATVAEAAARAAEAAALPTAGKELELIWTGQAGLAAWVAAGPTERDPNALSAAAVVCQD